MKKSKGKAFTLAEVLITLAIIGVVFALVIPSVLKNYNDKKYNTARLKALKTFGEAGKMASINGEINGQSTAKDFVNNVLSKYLKITKVCDKAEECGFPSQIQPSNPSSSKLVSDNLKAWNKIGSNTTNSGWTNITNEALSIYIKTIDGFSAKLFYNPNCARNIKEIANYGYTCTKCAYQSIDATCLNIIYDINSTKKPNHLGEDMGIVTVFWSGAKAISVAPKILSYNMAYKIYSEGNKKQTDAQNICANYSTPKDTYFLPNTYEMQSIAVNGSLIPLPFNYFWTSSPVTITREQNIFWNIHINGWARDIWNSGEHGVWCVRR